MEFDEVVVKESPGLCRCCLSEGCYKDLGSEYNWMGDTEIYADMLLECFDIGISQHAEGPNGPNRLICEVCITRLRDSCNFKKQVLDSEKRFIDMLHRGEFRSKAAAELPVMKQEAEALEVEYLDDLDFGDDGDDQPKTDTEPEQAQAEDITVTTLPMKRGRGRPRKSAPEKPERRAKVAKVEQPKASKAPAKDNESTSIKDLTKTSTPERMEKEQLSKKKSRVRESFLTILETSTVMPFRIHGTAYRCFYCRTNFQSVKQLKEHTRAEHTGPNDWGVTAKYGGNVLLKLDVTDIRCRVCNIKMENFDFLLDHLRVVHQRILESDIKENLILFKLSDEMSKCILCDVVFNKFHALLSHMHMDHKGHALSCEYCGISMSTESGLKRHIENKHGEKQVKCRHCDKVFTSNANRSSHENRSHGDEKTRQCNICNEVFSSHFTRDSHLAAVHDVWAARYECEQCNLVFRLKHHLSRHNRRVHQKERKFECDVCGSKYFLLSDLKAHSAVHTGERPFECTVCNKTFMKKKDLMYHTRIHTDDRRYVCRFCGQAFIQPTSLRLHLRVHHSAERQAPEPQGSGLNSALNESPNPEEEQS